MDSVSCVKGCLVSISRLISFPQHTCSGYYKMFFRMVNVLADQYNSFFNFFEQKTPRTNDFTQICCDDRIDLSPGIRIKADLLT